MYTDNPALDSCIDQLSEQIVPYLKSKGVHFQANGKCKCINPQHEDSTPSADMVPGTNILHCFGCQNSFSIFHCANIFDGLPISGPGFINTMIPALCKQFNIEPPSFELSEEQKRILEIQRAYQEAYNIIRFSRQNMYEPQLETRGWETISISAKYGIGFVENFNTYATKMRAAGFTEQFLKSIDLYNPKLFNENNMIFSILDHHGTPVGFAARNSLYDAAPPDKKPEKYFNTSEDCPIYKKREILYGFHLSKKYAKDSGLVIVEGYPDWITLQESGVKNCAAVGGTALTQNHVQLLLNMGIDKIYLCLDNDNGGNTALERILDKIIADQPMQVDIIILPEGQDPDDFLRSVPIEQRLEAWNKLERISCFEWRLRHFPEGTAPEEVADKMIPLILTEPHMIRRERMMRELCNKTGVRLEAIQGQVDRLTRAEEFKNSERTRSIVTAAMRDLKRNPGGAREIMASYVDMIDQYQKSGSIDNLGVTETVQAFKELTNSWANRKDTIIGIKSGFPEFDEAINGMQEGKAIGIGGNPNHGKSSFVSTIALNVAKGVNNAHVLFHSTDDGREAIFSRLVAIDQQLDINFVLNPTRYKSLVDPAIWEELRNKWYAGRKNIGDLLESGKLVIKDSTHGTTLNYTESMIKYYKEKASDKRFLVIFDNFHKSQDFVELDERIRFKRMSNLLKLMAERNHAAILSTMEYTKEGMQGPPSNHALAECLTGDSLIYTASGRLVRIDNIEPRTKVITINKEQKLSTGTVLKRLDKGIQDVFEITTSSGNSVKGTANHPLLTQNGWKKISELKEGEYIATPRTLPLSYLHSHNFIINNDQARFLGYMAGDGSYYDTPSFINKDTEYIQDITSIIRQHYPKNILDIKQRLNKGSIELSFSKKADKYRSNTENPLTHWIRTLGIWGQKEDKKRIPTSILELNNQNIKGNYLSGFLATDGSVSATTIRGITTVRVSFSTCSKLLALDLQTLLLQLGIKNSISLTLPGKSRSKARRIQYKVQVYKQDIQKFLNILTPIGRKYRLLKKYVSEESQEKTNKPCHFDNLPPIACDIAKQAIINKFNRVRMSKSYKSGFYVSKNQLSRDMGQQIQKQTKNKELYKWVYSDIYWSKVKTIIPLGKEQVWDIIIPGDNNFIANNIYCHNSGQMQYDLHVIMHVWNELKETGFNIEGKPKTKMAIPYEENGIQKWMPIISIRVGKSKQSGFADNLYFYLHEKQGRFEECPKSTVLNLLKPAGGSTDAFGNLGGSNKTGK